MVIAEPMTATVIRVLRPDTLLIRTMVPQVQSALSMYGVLMGTRDHLDACKSAIVDWVEIHQDHGRLELLTCDWLRDSCGRVLIDLLDLQSKESLVDYLIEHQFCALDGGHVTDVVRDMLLSQEPEDE